MVTEALSVEELLAPIIRQFEENYPTVQCEPQLPPGLRVRASRDGLREVLSCLLENAFQSTAHAEGQPSPRVTVRAERIGDTIRIDILDNGPGVAAKDRERIFEPYVTTKKGGEGKPMGTGMGLAIARRYAQHMGGRVGLDTERPETCFYVQLVAWKY
jgi:signal transduction histidine kinase